MKQGRVIEMVGPIEHYAPSQPYLCETCGRPANVGLALGAGLVDVVDEQATGGRKLGTVLEGLGKVRVKVRVEVLDGG